MGPVGIALVVLAVPFIIVLVIVALPFVGIAGLCTRVVLRKFRRKNDGVVFLICTSRRGWHDYLKNNLLPVAPSELRVIWEKHGREGPQEPIIINMQRSRIYNTTRPYLVVVREQGIRVVSLNGPLQEFKKTPKRSEQTQQLSRAILLDRTQAMLACASRKLHPAGTIA